MAKVSEDIQSIVEEIGLDKILKACIYELNREISANRVPLFIQEDFRSSLRATLKKGINANTRNNPAPILAMLLEGLSVAMSRSIVSMASIYPSILENTKGLPEEDIVLLRRGMEDYLTALSTKLIKKHIIDDHLSFSDFNAKIKKGESS